MKYYDAIVNEIDKKETGLVLYRLRVDSGLTTEDVCNLMGLESPRAIYKWENGESMPALKHLMALSSFYHVPLEHIVRCEDGEADASPIALIKAGVYFVIHQIRKRRNCYG